MYCTTRLMWSVEVWVTVATMFPQEPYCLSGFRTFKPNKELKENISHSVESSKHLVLKERAERDNRETWCQSDCAVILHGGKGAN